MVVVLILVVVINEEFENTSVVPKEVDIELTVEAVLLENLKLN